MAGSRPASASRDGPDPRFTFREPPCYCARTSGHVYRSPESMGAERSRSPVPSVVEGPRGPRMTRTRIFMLAAVVAAGAAAAYEAARPAHAQTGVAPDAIYYNAKVVTVDDRFTYAQAVAITRDKFSAVGTTDAVRKLAGPATRQIDLRGLTVIPGLTDNHLHNAGGGPGVDLSATRTLADVLAAVAARVRQSEPGEVVVSNSDWHEAQLKEQRLPLRRDLDKVAPM